VELKPGMAATPEELINFARQHLAAFKLPRHIVFAELPKTSTGKIQKHVLRAQARAQ
jgi:fatty-acyl-CoA synthase